MNEALAKRRETADKLTPRKHALLYGKALPASIAGPILGAVREGASNREAAAAGGLTVDELKYVFALAEDGHPAYREFRDDFFKCRNELVMAIKAAQYERARDPEQGMGDRKYALSLIDELAYPEEVVKVEPRGGNFQANQFVFKVQKTWEDDVVDTTAEVVDG